MHPKWASIVKEAHVQGRLKPFTFFLAMHPRPFVDFKDEKIEKLNIAQCWATAHFLYFHQNGDYRPILKALITQEGIQESPKEIIVANLPGNRSFSDLESNWINFLKAL